MTSRPLPGQELKRILNFPITADCLCIQRAKYMDVMGCKWCKANVKLIVEWLAEEHAFRKATYLELLERRKTLADDKSAIEAIDTAIGKLGINMKVLGRRVIIPFCEVAVKRVVLIAIKRAEKCK